MNEHEDPLGLLDDDGDGVIEMCLLEEDEQFQQKGKNNKKGCCVFLMVLGSSALLSIWGIGQYI
ncbi:MAG: hypothetical protein V1706_00205 [Pseudomonadota bacterium]